MTDEIMYRLMELSGQEYVDVYAAKVKADARGGQAGPVDARRPGRGPGTVTRLPGHEGRLRRRRVVRPAPTGPVARYFYDCEFIEDGRTIELISIGVVAEDGREFYAVSTEFDPGPGRTPGCAGTCWTSCRRPPTRRGGAAPAIRDELLRLPHRAGPARRALGLVQRLRPRRARAAVGRRCRTCRADVPRLTREIRQHWEAAGSPPIPAPGDRPARRARRRPAGLPALADRAGLAGGRRPGAEPGIDAPDCIGCSA